jgi:hypothetical protein
MESLYLWKMQKDIWVFPMKVERY